MTSPDHTKPILQSDDNEVKQILLRGPTAGQRSLFSVPDHRRRPDLPLEQREIIESNFAYQTTTRPSPSWSWEKTEKYVRYKDTLMLEYLYDYPVLDWVIAAEEARYALEALLAREGMRKLGLSIYAEDTPFSWWIRGEAAPIDDSMATLNEVEAIEDEQEEVEEVEGMEVEQEVATPEPSLASPNVSHLTAPAASGELRDPEDEHMSDQSQDDIAAEPTVKPEPRRSTRVAQQKLKDDLDQHVKEEPVETRPRTRQTKRSVAPAKGSRRKTVEVRQQDFQSPRRRSTRVSAKRTYADEPWTYKQEQLD